VKEMNAENTRDLYTRIGALYVALVSMEEQKKALEEELVEQQKQYSRTAQRFGNALAHLEQYDKATHDKIIAGETVPVNIKG
jgi:predicted anti-sigma-YlaC factor YlaD